MNENKSHKNNNCVDTMPKLIRPLSLVLALLLFIGAKVVAKKFHWQRIGKGKHQRE